MDVTHLMLFYRLTLTYIKQPLVQQRDFLITGSLSSLDHE